MLMEPHVLPAKLSQLEIWWLDMPGYARWFVGCVSVAAFAGVAGGVLA
jgi:hypothetical protein